MANYRNHVISYGETLQSISQDSLGDVARWVEIAILNDLIFPFITEDDIPQTKKIGQYLLVPDEGQFEDVIPSNEVFDIYEDAMGKDLSLFDEEPFLMFSEEIGSFSSDSTGDLATVRGFRNLRQSIILRFATPLGSLLHHPTYGTNLPNLIGKRGDSSLAQKLRIEIERTVRSDDRVEDITFDLFELDGDTLRISMLVRPLGFNEMLKLGFETKGVEMEWD